MRRLARSRAVEEVGYDDATRTLRVHFRAGGVYDYLEVPARVFAGLLNAAHPRTEWGEHIKRTYRFRRLA
jgi:hypothetical protein